MNNALPLSGIRILLTRHHDQRQELALRLRSIGAEVVSVPLTSIMAPNSWYDFDQLSLDICQIDWVFFTGAQAFHSTLNRLRQKNIHFPHQLKIAAVGRGTADLIEASGYFISFIPETFDMFSLVQYFLQQNIAGKVFWVPSVEKKGREVYEPLREKGAIIRITDTYRIVPNLEHKKKLLHALECSPDWIIFTSPSAVKIFYMLNHRQKINALIASIGKTTSSCLMSCSLCPSFTAKPQNFSGIIDGILERSGFIGK